jgi:sulfate adenylyltransferase
MARVQPPGAAPQWCPPVVDIDLLELLRSGVLDGGGRDDERLPVRIAAPPELPDDVEIVDPEGVPLALARLGEEDGRVVVAIVRWLGRRSSRPFERLHRSPDELDGAAPTLLVDPLTEAGMVASAAAAAPGLRVVLLGSVAGDGTGAVVQAIRRLEDALAETGATLVVVPADGSVRREVSDDVGAAYAHGGDVRTMWGDGVGETRPRGVVVLLTGLSGSGKSTIAKAVRDQLLETTDQSVSLLDGDEVRRHLSAGLTFSVADRETNIRRIGWVAAEIAHHGGLVICSPIAPFASTRADVRGFVEGRGGRFVLVHVATPLEECERRDRKGLYARARAGLIPDFTGISSPYETPDDADLVIDTTDLSIDEARDRVLETLQPLVAGVR